MSLDGEILVLRILIFSARLKNKWKKKSDFHHITLNFFLCFCVFARSVRCFSTTIVRFCIILQIKCAKRLLFKRLNILSLSEERGKKTLL